MGSLPLVLLLFISTVSGSAGSTSSTGTIAFTTLGRSRYSFDIFTTPISSPTSPSLPSVDHTNELQLTDGVSVNYNGFFVSAANSTAATSLLYVSERNGVSNIYLDINRLSLRRQYPLLAAGPMMDRPSLAGDHLVYVSAHEPSGSPRQSWAAVYSTYLPTKATVRLTPPGIADFSPSVSPSGIWTAVASSASGWSGEVQELQTGIYVFKTADGSERTQLVEHGGWPCWAYDSTLYFHRQSSDGWWSIYRAEVKFPHGVSPFVASVDRITPPGFHAFTPATSVGSPGIIAVATRRPGSDYRHIELLKVGSNEFVEVTRLVSPHAHHYNPFISPDGMKIGYHRCRGAGGNGSPPLLLENIESPSPESFSLFRIDGSFPSFSHDGKHIVYVELPGVYVVNSDGSGMRRKVFDGMAFSTGWDWKRKGVIYTSYGQVFAAESTDVDILSIDLGDDGDNLEPTVKKLTRGGENNAFPSASPDGKWVVFRSGRSGHKNLYVMDATEGEEGGIYQLTEGPWTDTMCNWSPDGELIAFASDRDNPGSGSYAIYTVRPDGTGLRKLFHSGSGGRANHPWFSPDSKSMVFTSDYGGVSSEPIANPHHYQPYGDIFTVNVDGSGLRRLTHNAYEDGTPTWASVSVEAVDVAETLQGRARCGFEDCHWLTIKAAAAAGNAWLVNGC